MYEEWFNYVFRKKTDTKLQGGKSNLQIVFRVQQDFSYECLVVF